VRSAQPCAVIFDMDGVIFDSEHAVFAEWQRLAEEHGFSGIEEVYRRVIGVNAVRTREIYLEAYGPDFPYDEYRAIQSARFHEKYDGGRLPEKPHIRPLLAALQEAGIRTAIASSTRTEIVEREIAEAGLRPYFDRVVGGDQVARSKPEPDIFLRALEMLDVPAAAALVIEDSHNGVRAAHRAGIPAVMVPDMLPPTEEIRALAETVLPDLAAVQAYLGL